MRLLRMGDAHRFCTGVELEVAQVVSLSGKGCIGDIKLGVAYGDELGCTFRDRQRDIQRRFGTKISRSKGETWMTQECKDWILKLYNSQKGQAYPCSNQSVNKIIFCKEM